jgi:integrase
LELSPAELKDVIAAAVAQALAAHSATAVDVDRLADNRRADDAGSSAEQEEHMITYYRWVGQPKPHNKKFRVYFRPAGGEKEYRDFPDENEAAAWATSQEKYVLADGHPIGDELDTYLKSRVDLAPSTVETLRYRLGSVVQGRRHIPAEAFPWGRAWNQYVARTATDTQAGVFSALGGFTEHLRKAGIIRGNVLKDIQVKGRKKRGKVQGRIDEARRLVEAAIKAGDPAALAIVVALSFGTRPGEVVDLRCRDVDAGGTVLWVDGTKTEAAKRAANVPPELRRILLNLVAGRSGDALLFIFEAERRRKSKNPTKARRDFLNRRLAQLCREAGIPRLTAHSLRGMHASFARRNGATAADVVAMLGHRSYSTTSRHYIAPGVDEARNDQAVQDLVLGAVPGLEGGRNRNDPADTNTEPQKDESPGNSGASAVRGGGIEPPWLLTASTSS